MTPLVKLDELAKALGVSKLMVKDESKRFGLNAFKVLGGSYCIGKYIANRLNLPEEKFNFATLVSDEVKLELGELTFVTATDGNHGRGVAWTANRLGHKSVVFMPEGTVPERLENIRKLGSDASIQPMNYDDCVRIPMRPEARSLNLSNSVAVAVFEALRQQNFPHLQDYGKMKNHGGTL
jgi:diaminopropionate ammonia-lyase